MDYPSPFSDKGSYLILPQIEVPCRKKIKPRGAWALPIPLLLILESANTFFVTEIPEKPKQIHTFVFRNDGYPSVDSVHIATF